MSSMDDAANEPGSMSEVVSLHSVPVVEHEAPVEPPAQVDPAMPSPGLPVPKPDIEPPVQIPDRESSQILLRL